MKFFSSKKVKNEVRVHNEHGLVRFTAMSKLIGIIGFILLGFIVGFTLYEMHRSMDYSALPQLIISAFAFSSIYAGFYLTMAKIEHIEEEKTKRALELTELKANGASQEEIIQKQTSINNLDEAHTNLISQDSHSLL